MHIYVYIVVQSVLLSFAEERLQLAQDSQNLALEQLVIERATSNEVGSDRECFFFSSSFLSFKYHGGSQMLRDL